MRFLMKSFDVNIKVFMAALRELPKIFLIQTMQNIRIIPDIYRVSQIIGRAPLFPHNAGRKCGYI